MAVAAAEYAGWLTAYALLILLTFSVAWSLRGWHDRTTWGDRPDRTAAGDDMAPADGAGANRGRCVADSAALSSAPAPTCPCESRAGGGHPDGGIDVALDDGPPVNPGSDATAERARVVALAVDHLASASLTEDDDQAIGWEDKARRELATLTTADLIEVAVVALMPEVRDRARVLVNQFRALPATALPDGDR